MQTELNVKVIKLISSEVIVVNVKSETDTMINTEYPAAIQLMNDKVFLYPFIPAFIETLEDLMKDFSIPKNIILYEGLASKQMINLYSDFMLKVQSSFSGIKLVSSLGNGLKDLKIVKG